MLRVQADPLWLVSVDSLPSDPEPAEQLSRDPLFPRFCFPFPRYWPSSEEEVDEEELKLLLDERRLAILVASCLLRSSLYLAIRRSAEFVMGKLEGTAAVVISETEPLISSGGSSPLLGSLFSMLFIWLEIRRKFVDVLLGKPSF